MTEEEEVERKKRGGNSHSSHSLPLSFPLSFRFREETPVSPRSPPPLIPPNLSQNAAHLLLRGIPRPRRTGDVRGAVSGGLIGGGVVGEQLPRRRGVVPRAVPSWRGGQVSSDERIEREREERRSRKRAEETRRGRRRKGIRCLDSTSVDRSNKARPRRPPQTTSPLSNNNKTGAPSSLRDTPTTTSSTARSLFWRFRRRGRKDSSIFLSLPSFGSPSPRRSLTFSFSFSPLSPPLPPPKPTTTKQHRPRPPLRLPRDRPQRVLRRLDFSGPLRASGRPRPRVRAPAQGGGGAPRVSSGSRLQDGRSAGAGGRREIGHGREHRAGARARGEDREPRGQDG